MAGASFVRRTPGTDQIKAAHPRRGVPFRYGQKMGELFVSEQKALQAVKGAGCVFYTSIYIFSKEKEWVCIYLTIFACTYMHMYDVHTVSVHIHINSYLFTGKYMTDLCKDMETLAITGRLSVAVRIFRFRLIRKGSTRGGK